MFNFASLKFKFMEVENTVIKNSMKAWVLAARPKTLAGAAVPIMVGVALAFVDSRMYSINAFSVNAAILCLLFAFIMQIDANFINDFFDYVNGNDDNTRLGPRRACAQGWISVNAMKKGIALTTTIACAVGLPLVLYGGLEMVLIGLICIVFCFLYTTHLSYLGMGDVLVLVFFGIIPVCISYYIQLHTVTLECFIISLACGLVIDTLLIVNNFRDIQNDMKAGKKTIAVTFGAKPTLYLYLIIGFIACGLCFIFFKSGRIWAAILPLVYLAFHFFTFRRMAYIKKGKALNIILGMTARNIFIFGLMVTLGILLK